MQGLCLGKWRHFIEQISVGICLYYCKGLEREPFFFHIPLLQLGEYFLTAGQKFMGSGLGNSSSLNRKPSFATLRQVKLLDL